MVAKGGGSHGKEQSGEGKGRSPGQAYLRSHSPPGARCSLLPCVLWKGRYSKVNDFTSWKKNVTKKALALGVPYVTFTIATWVLKTVFSDSVNKQADSLLGTLVLNPSAPYWYLYALFFIFLITPTFTSPKVTVAGLLVATAAKWLVLTGGGQDYMLYQPSSQMKFGLCWG